MNFETGGILASYVGAILGFIALLAYVIFLPTTQRNAVYLIVIVTLGVPFVVVLANSPGKLGQGLAVCFLLALVALTYRVGTQQKPTGASHTDIVSLHSKRPDAHRWLLEAIATSSGPLRIDALGIKLDTLYRVFKANNNETVLPPGISCSTRVVVQEAGSAGASQRASLEQHAKAIHDAEQYNQLWPALPAAIRREGATDIKIRSFAFMPVLYLIRVNAQMLIGTYLSGSGHEGMAIVLRREDGSLFDQFANYFEFVWDRLAKPLQSGASRLPNTGLGGAARFGDPDQVKE